MAAFEFDAASCLLPLLLGLLLLLAELLLEELVLALAHGGVSGIIDGRFLVVEAVELARLGPFGLLGLLGGPAGHGLSRVLLALARRRRRRRADAAVAPAAKFAVQRVDGVEQPQFLAW